MERDETSAELDMAGGLAAERDAHEAATRRWRANFDRVHGYLHEVIREYAGTVSEDLGAEAIHHLATCPECGEALDEDDEADTVGVHQTDEHEEDCDGGLDCHCGEDVPYCGECGVSHEGGCCQGHAALRSATAQDGLTRICRECDTEFLLSDEDGAGVVSLERNPAEDDETPAVEDYPPDYRERARAWFEARP